MAKTHELKFDFLPHLSYSLDWAASDYHLFPKLFFYGQKFSTDEEVKAAVHDYLAGLEVNTFRHGIVLGNYIGK